MGRVARLGSGWMRIARRLGEAQNVVLLALIYAAALGPLALWLRLVGRADLLELHQPRGELHQPRGESFALAKQQVPTDRARCERQF